MKLRSIVVFFIFPLFIATKTSGIDTISTFYRLLHQAKREIVQNPKNATLLVDSMKSLIKPGESNFALLAYELESEASFYSKDYFTAYQALLKIDSILKFEGDQQRIAVNYNRLGLLFTEWGVFDKALDYLTQALKIRIKLAEPAPVMFTLNAISHLYFEMGSDSLALKTIHEAIYYSKQVRDSFNVSHVYFSAGKIFEKIGNVDSAQYYYHRSLLFRDAVHYYSRIIDVYNGLARIALSKSNLDSTLFYLGKAFEFSYTMDESRLVESNLLLIEAYQKQNQNHLALLTARKIQDKIGFVQNINVQRHAYRVLAELYEKQGDIKNALVFIKLVHQLQDSMMLQYKNETNTKISTLLKVSQKEDKEKISVDMSFAREERRSFFLFLFLFTVIIIFIVVMVYLYSQRNKILVEKMQLMNQYEKLSKDIASKESDLLALRSEIDQQRANHLQQTQHLNQMFKSNTFVAKSIDEIMDSSQRIINKLLRENLSIQQRDIHLEKLFTLSLLARQRAQKIFLSFEPFILESPKNQEILVEKLKEILEKKIADIKQLNPKLRSSLFYQNLPQKGTINVDIALLSNLLENLLELSIQNSMDGELQLGFKFVDDEFLIIITDTRVLLSPDYQKLITEWQQLPTNDFPMTYFDKYNPWLFKACRIAKHLGIQLQFEHHSESGIIFLMRIKAQNTSQKKESTLTPDWSGKHILIAEDEILNYEVLKSYIKPTGAKVSHANSGIEIVEFIKTMKFDLVVMDIKMPRMDGLDALQMLKRDLPGIPVIACTAHASASERDNFIEMGFADLLLKPVGREALYQSAARFLQLTY